MFQDRKPTSQQEKDCEIIIFTLIIIYIQDKHNHDQ